MFIIEFLLFVCTISLVEVVSGIEHDQINRTKFVESHGMQRCSLYPWTPLGHTYSPGSYGLYMEIEHFYEYMQPTPTESALRKRVYDRIDSVVRKMWPNARIKLFGSTAYKLALPNSDVDLMVEGTSGQSPLHKLAPHLIDLAEPDKINVIDDPIPVIELIDRETRIGVDITLSNKVFRNVTTLINEYQRQYPALVKLVLVLKKYLKQRNLNDPLKGGISSYVSTLMCISYLQIRPRSNSGNENLGDLLLGFLKFFGQEFNYEATGITIENGGKYLPRDQMPCEKADFICIENPVWDHSNAAEGAYRVPDTKIAFNDAYSILSTALSSNNSRNNDCVQHSALSRIIVTDDFIGYRNWVRDTFEHSK